MSTTHGYIEEKLKDSVSIVRLMCYMYVIACLTYKRISNSKIYLPPSPPPVLENTNFDQLELTYSPIGEQQSYWRSCPTSSRLPQMTLLVRWDGTQGCMGSVGIDCGNELVPGVFFSSLNRGNGGLANPRRTVAHGIVASPSSLPQKLAVP